MHIGARHNPMVPIAQAAQLATRGSLLTELCLSCYCTPIQILWLVVVPLVNKKWFRPANTLTARNLVAAATIAQRGLCFGCH